MFKVEENSSPLNSVSFDGEVFSDTKTSDKLGHNQRNASGASLDELLSRHSKRRSANISNISSNVAITSTERSKTNTPQKSEYSGYAVLSSNQRSPIVNREKITPEFKGELIESTFSISSEQPNKPSLDPSQISVRLGDLIDKGSNSLDSKIKNKSINPDLFEVVQSAVDTQLQDSLSILREDMRNIHVELIKQFHKQKTEMHDYFTKYIPMETKRLQDDNESLRRTIRQLRLKYNEI